jgi:hypothetical protein
MKTALALALAMAVALALALFIRALVYAVVDALRLLADRKKRAIRMNQEADAKVDDTRSLRERRFVWEFSLSLTFAILVVGVIAFLRFPVSETTLVISGLYSVVVWIAGNQASNIHFLRIARADIHPFLVISMAISLWLCPLFLIWYVYEAGFKPAIVLLCIALALRLPLIALERLALKGSEWRISIYGIVAVPVLLACLVLLIFQQS